MRLVGGLLVPNRTKAQALFTMNCSVHTFSQLYAQALLLMMLLGLYAVLWGGIYLELAACKASAIWLCYFSDFKIVHICKEKNHCRFLMQSPQ